MKIKKSIINSIYSYLISVPMLIGVFAILKFMPDMMDIYDMAFLAVVVFPIMFAFHYIVLAQSEK
jgi:hypothetical protein